MLKSRKWTSNWASPATPLFTDYINSPIIHRNPIQCLMDRLMFTIKSPIQQFNVLNSFDSFERSFDSQRWLRLEQLLNRFDPGRSSSHSHHIQRLFFFEIFILRLLNDGGCICEPCWRIDSPHLIWIPIDSSDLLLINWYSSIHLFIHRVDYFFSFLFLMNALTVEINHHQTRLIINEWRNIYPGYE